MSESKNNTANTTATETEKKAWSTAAAELLAAHPHLVGISVAAIAGALAHFYYGHSPLTVAAWAAGGLITGEALARILAHAQAISEGAASAKATAEALKKAADTLPVFMAAQASQAVKLAALQEEVKALREEHAAAEAKAQAFRDLALKSKAEGEAAEAAAAKKGKAA